MRFRFFLLFDRFGNRDLLVDSIRRFAFVLLILTATCDSLYPFAHSDVAYDVDVDTFTMFVQCEASQPFAFGPAQSPGFRTKVCRSYASGHCRSGPHCAYIHINPQNTTLDFPQPNFAPVFFQGPQGIPLPTPLRLQPSPSLVSGTSSEDTSFSSESNLSIDDTLLATLMDTWQTDTPRDASAACPPPPPATPISFDDSTEPSCCWLDIPTSPSSAASSSALGSPLVTLRRTSLPSTIPSSGSFSSPIVLQRRSSLPSPGVQPRAQRRGIYYKTKPCKFFHERGSCIKGDKCTFIHEANSSPPLRAPIVESPSPLSSLAHTSAQDNGRSRMQQQQHRLLPKKPVSPLEASRHQNYYPITWRVIGGGVMMSGQREICRDYLAGHCVDGDDCRFAHPNGYDDAAGSKVPGKPLTSPPVQLSPSWTLSPTWAQSPSWVFSPSWEHSSLWELQPYTCGQEVISEDHEDSRTPLISLLPSQTCPSEGPSGLTRVQQLRVPGLRIIPPQGPELVDRGYSVHRTLSGDSLLERDPPDVDGEAAEADIVPASSCARTLVRPLSTPPVLKTAAVQVSRLFAAEMP